MLRHTGNDWNVNFGIASIPQGVESATPWSNHASPSQPHHGDEDHTCGDGDGHEEEVLELTLGHERL